MVHIGKTLQSFRKEKKINMAQISNGLCSVAFISQCEREEQVPDALLFEYLMERIGVSPEDFSIMATEEEYIFFSWRERVYDAIERKDWTILRDLSEDCKILMEDCNENIVQQMEYFIKGILEAVENKNWKKAIQFLKKAIMQTNPDMFQTLNTEMKLGTKELHMMILYVYYGVQAKTIDKSVGKELFYQLEHYISYKNIENYELVKIYPKLICIGLHLFENEMEQTEKIRFCETAVSLLRSTYKFYDITELLHSYFLLLKQENSNQLSFYEKQYQNFVELYQRRNTSLDFQPEYIVYQKPKVYLLTEYLYSKRMEKNWTQLQTSEGIYEPESYSRVERGITNPFPRKLQLLIEKLDINWCYYRGELETDNPEVYRLRRQHRILDIENKRKESLKVLEQMETLLDMDDIVNYQYIESSKIQDKYFLGEVDAETACEKLMECLLLTKKLDKETEYLVYYSQTEIELVASIAQILYKQKKYEEGISLLKMMFEQMTRSKVGLEYHQNGITFALSVLSDIFFACGEYQKSIKISNYVYDIYMKTKKGANLPKVLDAIADNLEHMREIYSEEYKSLYRQTYYIADFFEMQHIKKFIGKYYKENFDANMKWY